MNYNANIRAMKEVPTYRELAKKFGETVPEIQNRTIIDFVRNNTFQVDGTIQQPAPQSKDFSLMPFSSFNDASVLQDQVMSIFQKPDQKFPENLYVLAEEDTEDKSGLYKYNFEDFIEKIVPFIYDWGDLRNYWTTDAKTTTLTFHYNRVIFWRNNSLVPV